MKKALKVLSVIFVLCAALSLTAFASTYEHCADALFELGLFRGTNNGYELDREPTRAEAAAMLVRLLGAEEEALTLPYSAPFEDVDDWAKPYVQYLTENEFTNGTSPTTFGSSDICTPQQYVTFLLRVLGYSDEQGGDFTYESAIDFAGEIFLCDKVILRSVDFTRDGVCALSYSALSVAPKSGESDLLTKLVASGAVKDAKGYDELFEKYRAYTEVVKKFSENSPYSYAQTQLTTFEYEDYTSIFTAKSYLSFDIDEEYPEKNRAVWKFSVYNKGRYPSGKAYEDETKGSIYYKDGFYYSNSNGEKIKRQAESWSSSSSSRTGPYLTIDSAAQAVSIDAENKADNITVFTIKTSIDSTLTLTAKDGYPFSMKLEFKPEISDTDTIFSSVEIMDIKFGDDVSFDFPDDLDTYKYDTGYDEYIGYIKEK